MPYTCNSYKAQKTNNIFPSLKKICPHKHQQKTGYKNGLQNI
jgi:hypothetical protein